MAAAAVAKIDPSQTGAVVPVLIDALNSRRRPAARRRQRTSWEVWGTTPNSHSLPSTTRSRMIAPLSDQLPLKRSGGSPEIEPLLSRWGMSFFAVKTGLTARWEGHYSICWEKREEVDVHDPQVRATGFDQAATPASAWSPTSNDSLTFRSNHPSSKSNNHLLGGRSLQ